MSLPTVLKSSYRLKNARVSRKTWQDGRKWLTVSARAAPHLLFAQVVAPPDHCLPRRHLLHVAKIAGKSWGNVIAQQSGRCRTCRHRQQEDVV